MSEQFRIGDYNYIFDSTVALTCTGEDASFPSTNMRHYHLSKVLRTNGYFSIGSSNNRLDFKESAGGAEKRATLSSGTYTATTLAAEIKRAMEAAGTTTYTVSYSSTTGKWTISTALSYLALLWASGTDTATSCGATIGFDVSADVSSSTSYTGASIAINTEASLVIDLRTTEDIDSFAAFFDKTIGSKLTPEAVVKLQASASNVWTAPPVDVTLAFDETYESITHFFSSVQTYRYWRLKVVDPRNPNLYIEIPKLFLTKATQITAQSPEAGMTFRTRDLSQRKSTPYGHPYIDLYPQLRKFDFKYALLADTDLAILEDVFGRVGNAAPIFLALDPLATVYDKDRYCVYGYLQEEFGADHVFYTYYNTGLVLEEAL